MARNGLLVHTTTVDGAKQRRTVTTTNPDHTSTVTVFEHGRQESVTRLDKNGARVTQTTFAYAPFGRLQTQTDARNGPTTQRYDKPGRLQPVPDAFLLSGQGKRHWSRCGSLLVPDTIHPYLDR